LWTAADNVIATLLAFLQDYRFSVRKLLKELINTLNNDSSLFTNNLPSVNFMRLPQTQNTERIDDYNG